MTKYFSNGLTVEQLIKELSKLPKKDNPVYIASDEELNTLYRGFYLESHNGYNGCLIIAGLSGTQLE